MKKLALTVVIANVVIFYGFLGGKYWLELHDLVKNSIGEEKIKIENEIWGKEGQYGGIVMMVTDRGVWVWGKWWPSFFSADDNTVYYFYNACNIDILEKSKDNGVVTIPLSTYSEISDWRKVMKRGNYMLVKSGGIDHGNEWWGYSYWYFDHTGLIEQCQRF